MAKVSAVIKRGGRPKRPRLSVVVPVYNVEPYLAECLDSVLAQSFQDFEVVIVDDGSTDDSAAIAERYAASDRRLRLVRQQNAGLGAARNAGVRVARGDHLTFLDSDDTVPPHAYAALMDTIERTGSDLVVGTLKQDTGRRLLTGRLMRENHAHRREGVTLAEMPLILADVFAVNKIFRRSFWDQAGLEFPVGLRYEDQPTLTRAFLAAKRFDVIHETVYRWRLREDKSSITQRRHDVADLADRVLTKRIATEALTTEAPYAREVWFAKVLPVDMWEYFRAAASATEEYWQALRAAIAEFWNEETVPFDRTAVPVQQRLMAWLVETDRREDLAKLVAYIDALGRDLPVEVRGDRVVCPFPGVDDPAQGLPPTVYTLGPEELRWEARILANEWREATVSVHGFALIQNVPTGGRTTSLRARLVGPDGTTVELSPRPVRQDRATKFVGRRSQNYDDCGFEIDIDVAHLASLSPASSARARWRLVLERTVEGVRREGPLTSFKHSGVDLDPRPVSPTVEAALVSHEGELVLELRSTG